MARTDGNDIDFNLAMASQTEPWSEESAVKRCLSLLEVSEISTIMYGKEIPFGLNLQSDEAWITNPPKSLTQKIEDFGISMKYCSN